MEGIGINVADDEEAYKRVMLNLCKKLKIKEKN